jgi:phosphatidylethanolamine-binding protein (PEBP) family uncharacterized protein
MRLTSTAFADGGPTRQAMVGHILAQATLTGVYTLNPAVKL